MTTKAREFCSITRSDLYTRPEHDDPAANSLGGPAGARTPALVWDFVLGLGVLAYLLLVLFDGIESPLMGLLLVVGAGRRVLQPHLGKRPRAGG